MTTFFIADLHLNADTQSITDCFLHFIKHKAFKADALYILGDFFEAWVGDDTKEQFIHDICHALKTLSMHTRLYFMRGNRDFLLGKQFAKACGATLLKDPTLINLYGTPTLLLHGDTLCSKDKAYQRWRRIVHFWPLQWLFLALPRQFRLKIACRLRKQSALHTKKLNNDAMDVIPKTLEALMRRYKVTQVIHGHTHKPAIHYFSLDGQPVRQIVLGDWHNMGHALIYSERAPIFLINYPEKRGAL